MEGTLCGGGSCIGDPERYVKEGSDIGDYFHRGPTFGEHSGALLLRAFLLEKF